MNILTFLIFMGLKAGINLFGNNSNLLIGG